MLTTIPGSRRPSTAGTRVGVADLDVGVRQAADVVSRERLDDVAAELTGAADDDDATQKTPPMRLSVCSMSASSVIQSML